jgi:hypothetical protein
MFIEEMIFSGKHYYRQNELQACLEACKALPVESLQMHYNATSGTSSAWWTYQKISICFKAEFGTCQEMLAHCNNLADVPSIQTHDKWKRPITDTISQDAYKKIIGIVENIPCTL